MRILNHVSLQYSKLDNIYTLYKFISQESVVSVSIKYYFFNRRPFIIIP